MGLKCFEEHIRFCNFHDCFWEKWYCSLFGLAMDCFKADKKKKQTLPSIGTNLK